AGIRAIFPRAHRGLPSQARQRPGPDNLSQHHPLAARADLCGATPRWRRGVRVHAAGCIKHSEDVNLMRTTILVADDEAPMRKYISSNLKIRGYDVIAAADGIETLKLSAEHPLDLVLLDIGMPGPDGTQVLAALRRESNIPVIMVSARGRE